MKKFTFEDGGVVNFSYEPEENGLPHDIRITTHDNTTLRFSFGLNNSVTVYSVEPFDEREFPGEFIHRECGTFTLAEIARVLEAHTVNRELAQVS
jgi:hypothetical protein